MLNIKLKLTKLKVRSVDGLYEWKDIGGDISGNTTLQAALDKKMDKDEIPSLEGYATEEWVTQQGYLTEHQDLSTYAKKADIPSLEGYATEQWVNSKNYLTSHQSLEDYAKKTDLSTKANKEHTHLLKDITDYVAPNLSIYAKKTDIPSLNGYATEQWVTNQGYLTNHQSLEDYAKKTDLSTKADKEHTHLLKDITDYVAPNLSIYAKKTDIPSLNGYATEQWVTNQGYLTEHQSLTDYAKKSELKTINGSSLIGSGDIQIEGGGNGVQKWEGTRAEYNALSAYDENTLYVITDEDVEYATQQWVTNQGYLTTHQSLTDYAKKTDLSTKADKAEVEAKQDKLTNTETLTFLMEDGTSVQKTIYLK